MISCIGTPGASAGATSASVPVPTENVTVCPDAALPAADCVFVLTLGRDAPRSFTAAGPAGGSAGRCDTSPPIGLPWRSADGVDASVLSPCVASFAACAWEPLASRRTSGPTGALAEEICAGIPAGSTRAADAEGGMGAGADTPAEPGTEAGASIGAPVGSDSPSGIDVALDGTA